MGTFCESFSVKGATQRQVAGALRAIGRKAVVGPMVSGWVHFFDSEADEQDTVVIQELAERVSRDLGCLILAVMNHDDDVLYYWLLINGEPRDEYNSNPAWPEEIAEPFGGDAFELCAACGVPRKTPEVEKILRSEEYLLAFDRHQSLVEALGQKWPYPCGRYRDFESGDVPAGFPGEYERVEP
jgi:hypothetical protein